MTDLAETSGRTATVPAQVKLFSPILKGLLKAGVPLGFNRLVTIRGRRSGQPRTAGIAVIEVGGRRWVWAPWGEVNWVRNLRAARRCSQPSWARRSASRSSATRWVRWPGASRSG
jgi:F420H(2)-dependent quinone reductase